LRTVARVVALVASGVVLDRAIVRWVQRNEVTGVFVHSGKGIAECRVDVSAVFFRLGRQTGEGWGSHALKCGASIQLRRDVALDCHCP
jgi:hypothetical protein